MKKATELHTDHIDLISEISFLKKEIDFLLKLLRNSYCDSLSNEKLKLLDGYWKGFEKNIQALEVLENCIKSEEKSLADLFKNDLFDREHSYVQPAAQFPVDFYKINREVKTYKESFYELMDNCNACSYKKSELV